MTSVDIFNPLRELCRGVEADILNHLIHHPGFQSPAQITRAIRRSHSETLKCLHFLTDGGIITRATGSGRAYAILPTNAVGRLLLGFAALPRELANELATVMASRGETVRSITLAPEEWGILHGRPNLVVIVHDGNDAISPHLHHALLVCARRRFHTELHIVAGSAPEVGNSLHAQGIDTHRWPLCPASKGPHLIFGKDLIDVLGGTGGI